MTSDKEPEITDAIREYASWYARMLYGHSLQAMHEANKLLRDPSYRPDLKGERRERAFEELCTTSDVNEGISLDLLFRTDKDIQNLK